MKPNQNSNLTSGFPHTKTETDTLTPSSQVSTLAHETNNKNLPFDALRVKQSNSFSPGGTSLHWPVSSVVNRMPSVREIWGSIPGPVKSAQCRQRLATIVKFLPSCVAQALSTGDGPRHSLHASA